MLCGISKRVDEPTQLDQDIAPSFAFRVVNELLFQLLRVHAFLHPRHFVWIRGLISVGILLLLNCAAWRKLIANANARLQQGICVRLHL